ncbi:MAG: hypothetical protein ACPGJS_13170 [Flammeovirgaceae bacterium]
MTEEKVIAVSRFDLLVKEYQKLVSFEICYKEESRLMRIASVIIMWFCPTFLSHFTSVIGNRIYFPSRKFIEKDEYGAMRTLAHELVHLLDQKQVSKPVFMFSYLFPHSLAIGVFSFPFLGWWALLFLLFLAPIPSWPRFYFESRGYAMNVLTARTSRKEAILQSAIQQFTGWNYYRMYPFSDAVERQITTWVEKGENGQDKILMKVLLIYEMVHES